MKTRSQSPRLPPRQSTSSPASVVSPLPSSVNAVSLSKPPPNPKNYPIPHTRPAQLLLLACVFLLYVSSYYPLQKSLNFQIDLPMLLSCLIFLIPGYLHYTDYHEILEATFYAAVTFTSALSDSICRDGVIGNSFTTNLDRLIASSALFVVLRFTMNIRPKLHHKLIALAGVAISMQFWLKGHKHDEATNEYRFNHILWHIGLVTTGVWSVTFRPAQLFKNQIK